VKLGVESVFLNVCEHLVVKDYNDKILDFNNCVILKKLLEFVWSALFIKNEPLKHAFTMLKY
jgi:hypothetical protein